MLVLLSFLSILKVFNASISFYFPFIPRLIKKDIFFKSNGVIENNFKTVPINFVKRSEKDKKEIHVNVFIKKIIRLKENAVL